jgi:hypothetical protein
VARIDILDRGTIDAADSTFPQAVQLANGDVVASYSNDGGLEVSGGTDLSRSTDGGRTWRRDGTILTATTDPVSTNLLRVSASPDGRTVYAYGQRSFVGATSGFGERRSEPVLVTSSDAGRTWTAPSRIPMPSDLLEISHGILALPSGRLLAPAATIEPEHIGEQVLVAISEDGGRTWPRRAVAMEDPGGTLGYLEQKLARLPDGRLIASSWTVDKVAITDHPNSYSTSEDDGLTWTAPRFIGTRGQTLSIVPLGPGAGDLVMLLYNRRYGTQGIVMAIASMTDENWPIEFEALMYDAHAERPGMVHATGLAEMYELKFGFPTATALRDGTHLATWWAMDAASGRTGVHWARLRPTL